MTTKTLSDIVRVTRRFRRSVRIDADMDGSSLNGFVCTPSAVVALTATARQFADAGQGAFTWTGPYGCGKSSLAVSLAAFLGSDEKLRRAARSSFGPKLSSELSRKLEGDARTWRPVPIVGRKANSAVAVAHALRSALGGEGRLDGDPATIVENVIAQARRAGIRLLLVIDEMGKFLEQAASDQGDVYFFQLLAEAAASSDGHLLVIGILHQAFDDYAHRLTREIQKEWAKVQGRYASIPINVAGEEQVELISRAIEVNDRRPAAHKDISARLARSILNNRAAASPELRDTLHRCWPLHPTTACLLGPISRRRFGQAQRSIFGFLNSAEPYGFQEYLHGTSRASETSYDLPMLWSYLRANLEPAILASPDGHRWSLAVEAVERCEARGGDSLHLDVLKTVALIDLFRERSGLTASAEVLKLCFPHIPSQQIEKVVQDLGTWSLVIWKRHINGFAIFAGSDFDIEAAIQEASAQMTGINLSRVRELAALQPILAKRHYHETGAFRWFDVEIVEAANGPEVARDYRPARGATGLFLLLVGSKGEGDKDIKRLARATIAAAQDRRVVVGWARESYSIRVHASELVALETIRSERPELRGDAVARREVSARIAIAATALQDCVRRSFGSADWDWKDSNDSAFAELPRGASYLSALASALADAIYDRGPRIQNELLNRTKPSSNAVAGQRELLNAMIAAPSQPRLGLEGWPTAAGLYASILEGTGLHTLGNDGVPGFQDPTPGSDARIEHLWECADRIFKEARSEGTTFEVLYQQWRMAPYGVRDGLLPVLATAYLMTRRSSLAIYLDGTFASKLDPMFVDRLLQDPVSVRLRWSEFTAFQSRILTGLAEVVQDLSPGSIADASAPIDVARGIVGVYDALHPWVHRTAKLSADAQRVRNIVKNARDPNKLLLDDLPTQFGVGRDGTVADAKVVIDGVRRGLQELRHSYGSMLDDLKTCLLRELREGSGRTQATYDALRSRAKTVHGLTGDFRLDAFALRLSSFSGDAAEVEGIGSLAANKPARDWVDRDVDQARIEIAMLAQRFVKAEAMAHIKGREGRVAMAIFIGDPNRPAPVIPDFDVAASETRKVEKLVERLLKAIQAEDVEQNVALAAIVELGVRITEGMNDSEHAPAVLAPAYTKGSGRRARSGAGR